MNNTINAARNQRPEPVRYAGFWVRFVASFVDFFVISAFSCLIILLSVIFFIKPSNNDNLNLFIVLISFLVIQAFYLWYAGALVASAKRATWGQRLMGLQVVNLDGSQLSFKEAWDRDLFVEVRWLLVPVAILLDMDSAGDSLRSGKILSRLKARGPRLLFTSLDAGMIVFSKKKQSLDDHLTETCVIYKPAQPEPIKLKYAGRRSRVADAERRFRERGRLGV